MSIGNLLYEAEQDKVPNCALFVIIRIVCSTSPGTLTSIYSTGIVVDIVRYNKPGKVPLTLMHYRKILHTDVVPRQV